MLRRSSVLQGWLDMGRNLRRALWLKTVMEKMPSIRFVLNFEGFASACANTVEMRSRGMISPYYMLVLARAMRRKEQVV